MKRAVTLFLCLTILLNLFCMDASATNKENDLFSIIADDADNRLDNQADLLDGISEGVSRLAKDLNKSQLVNQQVSLFSSFMTGAKTLSLGLSLVNGTVSFLKLAGLMEDPNARMLNSIYDCLLDIQKTVQTIDKRTEDIQKSLTVQASTSTYQFRLDRYDSYQQSWNAFFNSSGSYDEMRRLTEAYQSEFNKRMMDYASCWQEGNENGIRALYSLEGIVVSSGSNLSGADTQIPKQPSYSDDGYRVNSSVTLPGSYIVVEDALINGETYLPLLEAAIREGTSKAMQDRALIASDASFYDNYEELDETQKAAWIEQLGSDFLDALAYDASYETANMNYGVGTFASAVKSAFTAYCSTVLGENGVTSPLESGLTKLSLTHAFEAEVREDAAAVCGYLAEIGMAYGEFVTFLTAMDRGMTSSQKSDVIERCLKAAYYPVCYYDSFITGYDYYCYPLNALLEYNEVSFHGTYTYKSGEPYEPKDAGWEIIGQDFVSATDDVKTILDNNLLISKQDMALLYLYYESAAAADSKLTSFNDYLDEAGLLPPPPSRYILGGGIVADSNDEFSKVFLMSSPSVNNLMKQKVDKYRTRDKIWGESVQFYKSSTAYFEEGEMDYSSEGESTVHFHDQMRADVFDTSVQGVSLDARIRNEESLAQRAYAYYVMKKNYGAGEYVYVAFANPGSRLYYAYQSSGTSSILVESAPFSMLSYSTKQARNDSTASVFGNGDWWIIGGGIVLISAAAAAAVCIIRKKKRRTA